MNNHSKYQDRQNYDEPLYYLSGASILFRPMIYYDLECCLLLIGQISDINIDILWILYFNLDTTLVLFVYLLIPKVFIVQEFFMLGSDGASFWTIIVIFNETNNCNVYLFFRLVLLIHFFVSIFSINCHFINLISLKNELVMTKIILWNIISIWILQCRFTFNIPMKHLSHVSFLFFHLMIMTIWQFFSFSNLIISHFNWSLLAQIQTVLALIHISILFTWWI